MNAYLTVRQESAAFAGKHKAKAKQPELSQALLLEEQRSHPGTNQYLERLGEQVSNDFLEPILHLCARAHRHEKSVLVTRLRRDLGAGAASPQWRATSGAPAAAFFCAFSLRSSEFSASRRRCAPPGWASSLFFLGIVHDPRSASKKGVRLIDGHPKKGKV